MAGPRTDTGAGRHLAADPGGRARRDGPGRARGWQLQGGLVTSGTRRLLQSAFDTYATSKVFYHDVADRVDGGRRPAAPPRGGRDGRACWSATGTTTSAWTRWSARSPTRAGATVVLDAGDDTSTGEAWESFSLDSLDSAFDGYDSRVAISGNHDNGTFVNRYLASRGLDPPRRRGRHAVRRRAAHRRRRPALQRPGQLARREGADLRRGQGADRRRRLRPTTRRASGSPPSLVHDANLGATALARGCTDLVLAGHLHVQKGPTRVVGTNGKAGYSYTNGTTGGAAYAIALGQQAAPRRRGHPRHLRRRPPGRPAAGHDPYDGRHRGLAVRHPRPRRAADSPDGAA